MELKVVDQLVWRYVVDGWGDLNVWHGFAAWAR
jgi:hypothetical protein